jgi:hypothetical protein
VEERPKWRKRGERKEFAGLTLGRGTEAARSSVLAEKSEMKGRGGLGPYSRGRRGGARGKGQPLARAAPSGDGRRRTATHMLRRAVI